MAEAVPYAPDFTPAALGREVGEDNVLEWLLRTVEATRSRSLLAEEIATRGFGHIGGTARNRLDMASHVVQGLQNYGLIEVEGDTAALTAVGEGIYRAAAETRDRLFAVHILTQRGGLRLVDEIRRIELRGQTPTMEDLAFLQRHPTEKSLSTMRAWLARAGVLNAKGTYAVNKERLEELLGERSKLLFGLTLAEAEFVFGARALTLQTGVEELSAAEVADYAETRSPDLRFRRKALGNLLEGLERRGLVQATGKRSGKGGTKLIFKLQWQGIALSEEELRGALSQAGFLLTDLEPIAQVLERLATGSTYEQGRAGEMLAIHVCLMLGLRNVVWRQRAPHAEIDLVADRVVGLAYQRWTVQVKNTAGDLSSDRVAREIGAAAGTGVTHVLFVAPRASLSKPARGEALHRSRLTPLHVLHLDHHVFADAGQIVGAVLKSLRAQAEDLAFLKREEAVRRERLGEKEGVD